MKANARKAFNDLKAIGAPVIEDAWSDSAHFSISGEENYDEIWASYYCEYGLFADTFGVNPKIEAILKKHDLFSEWANPGVLNVYDA